MFNHEFFLIIILFLSQFLFPWYFIMKDFKSVKERDRDVSALIVITLIIFIMFNLFGKHGIGMAVLASFCIGVYIHMEALEKTSIRLEKKRKINNNVIMWAK